MLPNVSKMIPGDLVTVNGKSGWVVSKLWAPKVHTEKIYSRALLADLKKLNLEKLKLTH